MLGVGVLGAGELDELDLLELVLADHAAGVLAVRAGFAAEAGRVGSE